jgi:hypothetical protein
VYVSLSPTGTTDIQRKDYGFRGSTKGYGHGTKIRSDTDEVFKIEASANEPQAFQTKERMAYYSKD